LPCIVIYPVTVVATVLVVVVVVVVIVAVVIVSTNIVAEPTQVSYNYNVQYFITVIIQRQCLTRPSWRTIKRNKPRASVDQRRRALLLP